MKKKTKMKMKMKLRTKKLLVGGAKAPKKPGFLKRTLGKAFKAFEKPKTGKAGNNSGAPKATKTSGAAAKTSKTTGNAAAAPPKEAAAAVAAPPKVAADVAPPKVAADVAPPKVAAAAAASTPAMPKTGAAAPDVVKTGASPAAATVEKKQTKGIVAKAQGMFAAVKAGGVGAVMGKVTGLLGPLQATLSKGIAGAKPLITKIIKAIPTPMLKALLPPGTPVRLLKMFPGMATSMALKFMPGDMKTKINSVIKPIGATMKSGVKAAGKTVKTAGKTAGKTVKTAAKAVKGAVPTSLAGAKTAAGKAGSSAKSGAAAAVTAVSEKMGAFKGMASGLFSKGS